MMLAVQTAGSVPSATEVNGHMGALPGPTELPYELYSSKVDLHARRWLRNLCGPDDRVTAARPDD